jgi:hypothetical protein
LPTRLGGYSLVIVTLVAVRAAPVPGLALAVAEVEPGLALATELEPVAEPEPVPEVWTMTVEPVVTALFAADVWP